MKRAGQELHQKLGAELSFLMGVMLIPQPVKKTSHFFYYPLALKSFSSCPISFLFLLLLSVWHRDPRKHSSVFHQEHCRASGHSVFATCDAVLQDKSHIAVTENRRKKPECHVLHCWNEPGCPPLVTSGCSFVPGAPFLPGHQMLLKNHFCLCTREGDTERSELFHGRSSRSVGSCQREQPHAQGWCCVSFLQN